VKKYLGEGVEITQGELQVLYTGVGKGRLPNYTETISAILRCAWNESSTVERVSKQ